MGLQLFGEIREARESYRLPRREAGKHLFCDSRTLENYEYGRSRTPLETVARAADFFRAPELAFNACSECPVCFPRIPITGPVEESLLANVARQAKEAREHTQAMEELMLTTYGKEFAEDLTPDDHSNIANAIGEGAEDIEAYFKMIIVLIKRYGYSMNQINKIIAQRLGGTRQKNKAACKAAK